jgi:hypothetical protein
VSSLVDTAALFFKVDTRKRSSGRKTKLVAEEKLRTGASKVVRLIIVSG